jgi:tetratricopeptide (TPR) repeat protein
LRKEREKEAKARAKARKKGKKRKAPPKPKKEETESGTTKPAQDKSGTTTDPQQKPDVSDPVNEIEDPSEENEPAESEVDAEKEEDEELEPIIDAPRVWDASNLPKTKDAYPEALLWMGRVYTERDMFGRAQQSFSRLEEYINLPKEVTRQLHPAKAHFYIVREQYPEASEQLELALENEPRNYIKARYAFILAQLYYRMGNNSLAMENFELARKWAIDYDLEFSARMRMAIAAGAAGGASMAQAISDLEAMLKDDKNKGYEDRIYYQIALIYMENGNMDAAKENLLASLRFSSNNEAQKAESYFALAEIFNDEEKYVKAKAYYDSTLMVMSEKDDRYVDATRWANSLEEIAKNIQIIENQDSLLRISALSDDEKKRLATDMVKDKLIAEAEKQAKAQAAAAGLREVNYTPPQAGSNSIKSNFFAYDEKTLRKGFKEFERRYGNRPLVDNWRRSSEIGGADKDPGVVEDRLIEELTQDEVDQILVGVPNSPEAEQQARTSIHNALYGLGVAFREKLYKPVESIKAFERLVREYPDSDKRVEACYYLYVNHQELDQFDKAKFYYDLIQEEYPESLYAKVLKDPAYVNTLETEERKLLNYYNQTYISFEQGNHQDVISRVEGAAGVIPSESHYMPKLALLEAMSVGAIEGKDGYIEALREMIANFPGTEEQVRAKEILRFIQGDANAFGKAGQLPEQDLYSNFREDFNRLHYVIVVLYNQQDVDLNAAKASINGFNRENFKRKDLRVTNIYLDQENTIPVIIIRKFNNSSDAMDYYDATIDLRREFLPEEADYEVFAINQRNYREVIKTHTTSVYSQYFQEKYVENR